MITKIIKIRRYKNGKAVIYIYKNKKLWAKYAISDHTAFNVDGFSIINEEFYF